jgi:hypothetical protein
MLLLCSVIVTAFLNTKIMTTATTDILEKLREEIEFINKNDSREDRYYQSGLKLALIS